MIHPLLILPALFLFAPAQNATAPAPPGLAALSGGRTTIGSSIKEIEKLVEGFPAEAKVVVRSLDGETPQHTASVEAFHLGRTEITNEQYAAFVRASGHRPPQEWGADAIEAGRKEFFEAIRKALEAGEEPQNKKFDGGEWWSDNWNGREWAVPEGDELRPVTSVDYGDAMAYCRWAGLRLPTEFEFQHASRGKSKDPFPWGDEWEDGVYAATSEYRRLSRTVKVGSFEKGSTKDGIHDLAGNVWEWTSSPYVAFPDFKKNEYKIPGQRKKVSVPTPKWDGNQRVVRGGSYQNSKMAARVTVRRGSDRDQMTNALGFRVAATPMHARDLAELVWEMDLRNADARPSGVTYELGAVMGMDTWNAEPGTEGAPEGYQVITGYEYLAFVPRVKMEMTEDTAFRKATLVEPQHLGFLTLSMPAVEPALAAGTYLVAFRAKGDTRYEDEKEGEDKKDDEEEEPKKRRQDREDPWAEILDLELDHVLLYSLETGELAGIQPVEGVAFGKTEGTAGFSFVDKRKKVEDPANPGEEIEITERWLRIKAEVATRLRRHVLPFSLDLRMEPDFKMLERDRSTQKPK